jgi:Cdc6-like AAA superfamily ATPase
VDLLVKAAEDNRDNLVIILAGYTGPMESFLQMNPGLKSRFRTVIEFPDYTENELVTIFERMVEKSDYTCDEATVAELRERIRREEKNESFGNARFVRNCFEAAIVKHAWRLRDVEAPTKDQLVTLTAEDIHDDTVSSIILPDTVSDMPSESDGEEVDRAVSI